MVCPALPWQLQVSAACATHVVWGHPQSVTGAEAACVLQTSAACTAHVVWAHSANCDWCRLRAHMRKQLAGMLMCAAAPC
jgi:hypothetical protein